MKLTEELAKKIYEITNTDYSDQLQDYEIIDLIEELVNEMDAIEQQKEKTGNADEFGGYDPRRDGM